MRLLTKEQAKELDDIAISRMGISGIDLMGRAGKSVAEYARNMISNITKPNIAIICGKGNNAGDGYKAALELYRNGFTPEIFTIFDEKTIRGDAKYYYDHCIEKNLSILPFAKVPDKQYELIIDAILGTGFNGELREPINKITKWINNQNSRILSIDIPTGVNANNGQIAKDAVIADATVTMGEVKVGMLIQPAKSICGEIFAVDIGFPDIYNDLKGSKFRTPDEGLAYEYLIALSVTTYKHKQGKVLIIAGSRGMTGAAILASNAAIRSGAGLVTTFAPRSISNIYETNIIEGLTAVCEDSELGYFSENNFEEIIKYFGWADALLIGPGLGTNSSTIKLVEKIIKNFNKPILIDADALNLFNDNIDLLSNIKNEVVITPHYGELARLLKKDINDIKTNIINLVEDFSKYYNVTLVAKNAPTLVVNREEVIVNTTGNQGLATGGTGDVLSGIITSFLAQGIPCSIASELGVFVHGKAADLVKEEKGYRGLIASDIIDILPYILKIYE